MALYRLTADAFEPVPPASFTEWGVRERDDLQRLLRTQAGVVGDDLYVLAEEFGDWEDSRRRIDLLALDAAANLVVVELKRTSDGGHMELQAIRYAGMVSTMTFERAEAIHRQFLLRIGQPPEEARSRILEFLGWDEPDEESFAPDVRIILVSEDFGKELTTAVLWLRERGIDIRCVRMRPYRDGEARFVDVQQIIPLPEAHEYQIQLREKEQAGRKQLAERSDLKLRFWEGVVAIAQRHGTRHGNIKPGAQSWLGATAGVPGAALNYGAYRKWTLVELYIDRVHASESKALFDHLYARKSEIEAAYGAPLSWERLDTKRACRVKHVLGEESFLAPESDWPQIQERMVAAMIRFESALRPALDAWGG